MQHCSSKAYEWFTACSHCSTTPLLPILRIALIPPAIAALLAQKLQRETNTKISLRGRVSELWPPRVLTLSARCVAVLADRLPTGACWQPSVPHSY